ncbi:B12-binding domain-containing radical SAM protein [bacterium]|nr:B12-binding domain-containing radical SAM protein [bacterium]
MKILLVNPYFLERDANETNIMKPYPPLGLLMVAAALREAGHEPVVFDGTFESYSAFRTVLNQKKPDLVGLYANVVTREVSLDLIRICREAEIELIVGGPEPCTDPQAFLKAGALAVVNGEGEITATELVNYLADSQNKQRDNLDLVAGVYMLRNGTLVQTAVRPRVRDLDTLPMPARDLVPIERYLEAWRTKHGYSSLNLITSRGCPYQCTWCSKAVFGDLFTQRSVASVLAEIKTLQQEYAPDQYWFADDLLTLNRDWILELSRQMSTQPVQVPFECLARVDRVDQEILSGLHRAGCYRIWYGGESGSDKMIRLMKKGFTTTQIGEAVKLTKQNGIEAGLFILIGYPGETMKDLFLTLSMIRRIGPTTCGTSVAYPIKGTVFYEQVKDVLSPDYTWSQRNENRISFRGLYSERYYWFAVRLVNNWNLYYRGKQQGDSILKQLVRAGKIMIAGSASLVIGLFCHLENRLRREKS